ncbi:MAG: helveticin J family class III bacteriocin [Lentilactobacillus diolivorans]
MDRFIAIQGFVGSTYVYALQLFNSNRDVVISRVRKDSVTNTYDLDFTNAASMYLKNFGHGQTFEYFKHANKDYWWVVTKGDNTEENWGSQIARIQFSPNTYDTTPYDGNTSVTRLSSVSSATKNGKPYGKILRVEAALSSTNALVSGSSTNRLLLIAGVDTNYNAHFTLYDNDKVNDALDNVDATHGFISCGTLTSALVSDPYEKIDDVRSKLTSKSIQGFDISDGRAVYISSGQAKSKTHSKDDTPGIAKYYWGNKFVSKLLNNTNWSSKNVETEGIQISNDLYVGISYHDTLATKTLENRLYVTAKASW